MKIFVLVLMSALALAVTPAKAQTRVYTQAELDALLAPVALYPDALLSQVLMAATYPADVGQAAAFSRANPHLKGEDAVNAAYNQPWDPSVKSLLAFPEVLQRMDESPQWMMDLGQAFLTHEPHVMDTVQGLRRRAHAAGQLQSNPHQSVQSHGSAIAIVPVQPHVVHVPYYDPYVVYGTWWWPHYRPVHWRPWRPAPVFVSAGFFFGSFDWHHRHVRAGPRKWHHHRPRQYEYQRVPEAQRQPIVRSLPPAVRVETPRPAAVQQRREIRRDDRRPGVQPRPDARKEMRRERHDDRREAHRRHHDRRG